MLRSTGVDTRATKRQNVSYCTLQMNNKVFYVILCFIMLNYEIDIKSNIVLKENVAHQ